ncbi:MAG: formylglycine-generating enzyme family protein [Candidatus Coatesbacteria bacterium]|nr:formylglycine-generating enzyme family protein [Candidatus Coatesbacteria bacterium]
MRAAVAFWTMVAMLAGAVSMGNAAPTVVVSTDKASYVSGSTIEVSLSAENTGSGMAVDLFFGLLARDGRIYALGPDGWSSSLEPWIPDIYVPPGFVMDRTPFWWFDVPCSMPPISGAGHYDFAALLTQPGSPVWWIDLSLAPFSIAAPGEITMILIPAGSFLMGSPEDEVARDEDEGPQRTVNISTFQMSETEVTQSQWESVMGWNESTFSGDDRPVERVTWFDCVWFCNQLSEADGYAQCYTLTNIGRQRMHITSADVSCNFDANGYRLPTEAEWEFACRAGTGDRYYWGDSSDDRLMKDYCWYQRNADEGHWTDPHADEEGTQWVRQKIPNGFGLCDISGNVEEWCWDWYDDEHYSTRPDPDRDPTGPSSGFDRVQRGGRWNGPPQYCRSANRAKGRPWYMYNYLGFRVARSCN